MGSSEAISEANVWRAFFGLPYGENTVYKGFFVVGSVTNIKAGKLNREDPSIYSHMRATG